MHGLYSTSHDSLRPKQGDTLKRTGSLMECAVIGWPWGRPPWVHSREGLCGLATSELSINRIAHLFFPKDSHVTHLPTASKADFSTKIRTLDQDIGMHVYVQVVLEISLHVVVLSDKACQVVGRSTNMFPPFGASLVTAIANSHLFFVHVYGVGWYLWNK